MTRSVFPEYRKRFEIALCKAPVSVFHPALRSDAHPPPALLSTRGCVPLMLRFSIAARGFRQQLQRCAAAARCQPPLPVPPTTRCFAMSAAAQDGQSVDALKRRVREEVKAALRALSTEQMAAESEWRCDRGWAGQAVVANDAAHHRGCLQPLLCRYYTLACIRLFSSMAQARPSQHGCWPAARLPMRHMPSSTCTVPSCVK